MTSRRDLSHAAPYCLRVAMSLAAISSGVGCSHGRALPRRASGGRALLASFVPKLDLRWQLQQSRSDGNDTRARVDTGFAAWLRWQPSLYAAQLPSRYELSPAAWAAPCELDDVTCLAELAESEPELAQDLQEDR
jgi:hypothetical protein